LLVCDVGQSHDVISRLSNAVVACGGNAEKLLNDVAQLVNGEEKSLRRWIAVSFFDVHLKNYSMHRRRAPVYWQFAIPSRDYSIWCYYHDLTRETFYKVLNDHVKPKVEHEQRKLDRLRTEAGENPSRAQWEMIEAQEKLVEELRTFCHEVERITPLWNPNLNDGVLINCAPLWRLVPQHREWQKECKACWDKLVAGDYDWSHLAMHLWPERVVPKCQTDPSMAIAHGLEEVFWAQQTLDAAEAAANEAEPSLLVSDEAKAGDGEDAAALGAGRRGPSPRWVPREEVTPEQIAKLIAERTSPAVKAALENLLSAPSPLAVRTRARGGRARKARPRPRRSLLPESRELTAES
jgi:hypothetical protein